MLKYLIVLLGDDCPSFCHYPTRDLGHELMPLSVLQQAVRYAMMENLQVQFLAPDQPLPKAYVEAMSQVEFSLYARKGMHPESDVEIVEVMPGDAETWNPQGVYILRIEGRTLFEQPLRILDIAHRVGRLNVVLTDVDHFGEEDLAKYEAALRAMGSAVVSDYREGHWPLPELNLLTDRMALGQMNNCDAGVNSITVAPDGRFYLCPAFYYDRQPAVGSLEEGVDIPNRQLLQRDHAPICRLCDAYQCRRCVWFNHRTTREQNTPGHEQCVVAHLERNASRRIQLELARELGLDETDIIPALPYLDPFEIANKWNKTNKDDSI
ncbi:MAG: CXXX repeat peptide maturase [Bacteroidaceae bacterium]|nr:CXXX repeat peptide maturase [Bacteroidaceae bacterium]